MSTALQLHDETMAGWQTMRSQAETLIKSQFLPKDVKTPEQALAIILMGRELGIGIMQSFSSINIIAGKPTIGPQLMLALINRTGQLEDMLITDDGQCCAVTMRRKGRQPHSEAFSMKDAALMKTTEYINGEKRTISLSEKYNWKQQPAVMRKWRAVAACARVVFPDVILGVYTPDELGAEVDGETGEVVTLPDDDVQPVRQIEPPAPTVYDETSAEPYDEPEPVRTVKLEGAQPADGDDLPIRMEGAAGHVIELVRKLKWSEAQLARCIEASFGVTVMPGKLADYLAMATRDELRELYRIINSQGKNRTK